MAGAGLIPSVSDLTFRDLAAATSSVEDTIGWMQQHGLLAAHMACPVCGAGCNMIRDTKRTDGCRWRCQNGDCRKDVSIR